MNNPDVTDQPAILWRCVVCDSETATPRLDMQYAAPYRCVDIFCDGPVLRVSPNADSSDGAQKGKL